MSDTFKEFCLDYESDYDKKPNAFEVWEELHKKIVELECKLEEQGAIFNLVLMPRNTSLEKLEESIIQREAKAEQREEDAKICFKHARELKESASEIGNTSKEIHFEALGAKWCSDAIRNAPSLP